jgi:hypothetical protein
LFPTRDAEPDAARSAAANPKDDNATLNQKLPDFAESLAADFGCRRATTAFWKTT